MTDPVLRAELLSMAGDAERIEDAFWREMGFGTGGIRGVMGAGTDRMNINTVTRAALGLGRYLRKGKGAFSVAVGYDTRENSRLFAEYTARAIASLDGDVYLFDQALPTPLLSYAVRSLACDAGVMITASHNPKEYNGFKVYGADGCQITDGAAKAISEEIAACDYFCALPEENAKIHSVPDEVIDQFVSCVQEESVLYGDAAEKSVKIVYTSLHGTGYLPVMRVLKESGFANVIPVSEQAVPDGTFPTCAYPNPELPSALSLGIVTAEREGAELLLATDPDADRVGVAVRSGEGFTRLDGNEVGLLLLYYLLKQKTAHGKMPPSPLVIKTVVTAPIAERVAAVFGVETRSLLTGFKYIGEALGELEARGESERFVLGFEESCGYLSGSYVRDKDGVCAALLIAEMCAFYRARGKCLLDVLREIYAIHGYEKNYLHSYAFKGSNGASQMKKLMDGLRYGVPPFANLETTLDYAEGVGELPQANVLAFLLADGSRVTVRPSGTEPKLKLYLSVRAKDEKEAVARHATILRAFEMLLPNEIK